MAGFYSAVDMHDVRLLLGVPSLEVNDRNEGAKRLHFLYEVSFLRCGILFGFGNGGC